MPRGQATERRSTQSERWRRLVGAALTVPMPKANGEEAKLPSALTFAARVVSRQTLNGGRERLDLFHGVFQIEPEAIRAFLVPHDDATRQQITD